MFSKEIINYFNLKIIIMSVQFILIMEQLCYHKDLINIIKTNKIFLTK